MHTICEITGCANKAQKGERYCKYHLTESATFDNKVAHNKKILVKICSVEGCGRVAKGRGMCSTHYNQYWKKHATFIKCSVEGCEERSVCRGLCSIHYNKLYRDEKKEGTFVPRISTKNAPKICSVEGCNEPHRSSGYCATHYALINTATQPKNRVRRKRGQISAINATHMKCIVMGCDNHQERRGMCVRHNDRMTRTGYSDFDKYLEYFKDAKRDPVKIVATPTKTQPLDKDIAITYYGCVLEGLSEYKHVIKIAREMFEKQHKITAVDLTRYNEKNRVYISEYLYRLYYKYNMGLIPFIRDNSEVIEK